MKVAVRIAPFSQYKTVAKLKQILFENPFQVPNTPEAFAGKVFEVWTPRGYASLDELYRLAYVDEVAIQLTDGWVIVKRHHSGTWRVLRENYTLNEYTR